MRRSLKTVEKTRRLWYLIPILVICLVAWFLLMVIKQPTTKEIEILGHEYSPKLQTLYEKVCVLYKKPITVIEIEGHVDDSIEPLHEKEILLKLHRGCSEDIIAHELMHAVMHIEGYPVFFSITSPSSTKIYAICAGDLDHIIINDRLLELGYDARQGFLKQADGYNNFLLMRGSENPDEQAILEFGTLHQLIKYHYYIRNSSAQADILERFPQVAKYWQKLSSSIERLPPKPKPQDVWKVAAEYITLSDAICVDLGASIRVSDLIGLEPLPLHKGQLSKTAKSIFVQKIEDVKTVPTTQGLILLRTFLAEPKIMLSAVLVPRDSARVEEIDRLTVGDLLQQRNIRYILVD